MDFTKFAPLLKKQQAVGSDKSEQQKLLDLLNQTNGTDAENPLELMGVEQNPEIPMAPEEAGPAPAAEASYSAPIGKSGDSASEEKSVPTMENKMTGKTDNVIPHEEGPADYMQQLRDAQSGQNNQDLVNNMLRAGTTIGSALAYQKPDYTAVDALAKQSGQGVENVKTQMAGKKAQTELDDEVKLRDPNSDVSKAFREALKMMGIKHTEQTNAADAKAMGINISNFLAQREARENAREMKEMMLGDRAKQQAYGATDRSVQNLMNSKDYKSYTNAKDALNSLDHAIATGDKTAIGTSFMGFAKFAQNDDSVVRSEDMKTLAGHYNYASPADMISKLSAKAHGADFSAKELEAMKAVINKGIALKGQRVGQMLNPIEGKIKGSGLNMEEHIDPALVEELGSFRGMKPQGGTQNTGMVKVTRISDGASKMMSAEQAAKADPTKYTIGK